MPPIGRREVRRLTLDTDPFLSCDECFEHSDWYVEALLDRPVDPMPAMHVHLRGCPACREEVVTLLLLSAEDTGRSPVPALAVLAPTDEEHDR